MTTLPPVQNTTPPAARNVADRTALNLGIWFTVIICLAIIALGGWLTRFELATPDLSDGFFYEWQLATSNFWNAGTAWIGFALPNLLVWLST